MIHKIILALISVMVFIVLISCQDESSSIGVELISGDYIVVKTFDSQLDSTNQSSSYFKKVIPLGTSTWNLIGKYQDINASTLIRFIFSLSDSLESDLIDNNINVLDAWIVLRNRYTFGDTLASMEFTTHKVNSYWSPTQFSIDSLSKLQFNSDDIGSNLEITDTTHTFKIDESLVLAWMKNSADNSLESNYGIYLQPKDISGKVVGFEALTAISSEAAKLFVVVEKAGVYTDTINGLIFSDVSLVEGNLPSLPQGSIGIQSSIAINAKLKFDISGLPKGLVVNNAELTLIQDTVNSVLGSGYSQSIRAFFLSDEDSLETTGNPLTLTLNNKKFTGNISSFLRNWIETGENNGILLEAGNQVDGLELFAIYGSDANDFTLRPRLKVTYTVKENL